MNIVIIVGDGLKTQFPNPVLAEDILNRLINNSPSRVTLRKELPDSASTRQTRTSCRGGDNHVKWQILVP